VSVFGYVGCCLGQYPSVYPITITITIISAIIINALPTYFLLSVSIACPFVVSPSAGIFIYFLNVVQHHDLAIINIGDIVLLDWPREHGLINI